MNLLIGYIIFVIFAIKIKQKKNEIKKKYYLMIFSKLITK